MQFKLISDNNDTLIGLRLAGIDGVIAENADELIKSLKTYMNDENVAVILVTEKLCNMCSDIIDDMKLNNSKPLLLQIPDRHCSGQANDTVLRYVREAIGIKI